MWMSLAESLRPTFLVLGILFTLGALAKPTQTWARTAMWGLLVCTVGFYLSWRFTVIPTRFENIGHVLYAHLFLTVEVLGLFAALLSVGFMTRRKDRHQDADAGEARLRALHRAGGTLPPVDVFICTYNEEPAILERTVAGALGIDYPNLRIFVCDDTRRPWLKDMCALNNVGYITRPDNKHAKAGNINNALAATAGDGAGAFILVLDADFVPLKNILLRTVGLFDDPKIAVVQTPQCFFNADPLQSNLVAEHKFFDEQRLFFDIIQPAKDAWGAAIFCGTSAILRRQALVDVGGIATETVTEDALTSFKFKSIGYETAYLNERLSLGLAPEGISAYLTQRARWCLGSIQQIWTRWGAFGEARIGLANRLSYIDALGYWLLSFPLKFMILLAPSLYWLFGYTVIEAPAWAVLYHALPMILVCVLSLMWISRNRYLPILNDAAQMLIMFDVMTAAVLGLLRPGGKPFKVTPKGQMSSGWTVHWPQLRRFALFAALTIFSGFFARYLSTVPRLVVGLDFNLVLALYAVALLLLCMGLCVEPPRWRAEERFKIDEPVKALCVDEEATLQLHDLSINGARVSNTPLLTPGMLFCLCIADAGVLPARVVRAHQGGLSVVFEHSEDTRRRLIQKLFSGAYGPRVEEIGMAQVFKAVFAWIGK